MYDSLGTGKRVVFYYPLYIQSTGINTVSESNSVLWTLKCQDEKTVFSNCFVSQPIRESNLQRQATIALPNVH